MSKHPFGPAQQPTDHGVMPPRKRTLLNTQPDSADVANGDASDELASLTVQELRELAVNLGAEVPARITKTDLIELLQPCLDN